MFKLKECFGFVALLLSGCATMNESECKMANWQAIGEEDGSDGRALSHFKHHREACSEHGVRANQTQWKLGWDKGVRHYCKPDNGLTLGKAGKMAASVCPEEMAAAFVLAHRIGKELYDVEKRYKASENELEKLYDEYHQANTAESKERINRDISRKKRENNRLKSQLNRAEMAYNLYLLKGALSE